MRSVCVWEERCPGGYLQVLQALPQTVFRDIQPHRIRQRQVMPAWGAGTHKAATWLVHAVMPVWCAFVCDTVLLQMMLKMTGKLQARA